MRLLLLFALAALAAACNNDAPSATAFCDTTCRTDSFRFQGDHSLEPRVSISVSNCLGDTLSWTHKELDAERKMQLSILLNNPVRLSDKAMDIYFKDTSYAYLTFNDCITGRGYLLKLPFNKKNDIQRVAGALNRFDPKFAVPQDLRAYTDRGSLFVVDVATGKEAQMTFGEKYPIDFTRIHETVDSIQVSRSRIWVRLFKNGQPVELEKNISL